jgi:signal transduction histidine kinase/DNA-binding response OmpR family regulator
MLTSLLTLLPRFVYGQKNGIKYSRYYSPLEYGYQPQNWSILQDKRGLIYVGNHEGLLEFDGVSWRIIRVPNWSVLSMVRDVDGRIFVGGKNEIGMLTPNSKGTLEYRSLLHHLKENQGKFSGVWSTHRTKDGIYFQSLKYLFRWNPKTRQMKSWTSEQPFLASFNCRDKLYVRQKDTGLMEMTGDSLQLLPGGTDFARKKIYMMVDAGERGIMIGTQSEGLFLYDGTSIAPFSCRADSFLKANGLTHGIRLRNGHFALATRHGMVVMDAAGNIEYIFDKSLGLKDEHINWICEDTGGNLWLALSRGITKLEYASPFTFFDERTGLPGIVLAVARHEISSGLYIGTTKGLYVLGGTGDKTIRPLPGITGTCWSVAAVGNSMLAAASTGLFQVQGTRTRKIDENCSFVLLKSKEDPTRTWAGTKQGISALRLVNGKWTKELELENISVPIRTIAEETGGTLWLGTLTKGVLKVDLSHGIFQPVITVYGTAQGLPPQEINVFSIAGHTVFATDKGLFRFEETQNRFVPDNRFGNRFADGSRDVFRIAGDRKGNVWLNSRLRNLQAAPLPDGGYRLNSTPFLRLPKGQANEIYPDPSGETIWISGNYGLTGYDTTTKKTYRQEFRCLIRKVELTNDKTLIFNGYEDRTAIENSTPPIPIIAHKDKNLRFEFAAPFYEGDNETRYRCRLEGYETRWLQWTPETYKEYTNLDDGRFTFRVQAMNIYRQLSREATFSFRILPPWYKTWWAFLVYLAGFLLVINLSVKWRSSNLEKEKHRLEQVIKERTKEISKKKNQLETQTLQLTKQSHQLKELDKAKSRFFANISHEFRTPLTLIMGPLEHILSTYVDNRLQHTAGMMLRNSQRLLGLIDQLLELSRLESGKLILRAAPQNVVSLLRTMLAAFESLLHRYNLTLTFLSETENLTLYLDTEKFEKIIANLLSNAIKFTPPGGKITVSLLEKKENSTPFPNGFIEISVKDTGIGIPADRLPHIFNRFFQVTDSHEHEHKGSGIGLELTHQLVRLHGGRIEVHSSTGENKENNENNENKETAGTEFIIRLPMGNSHLAPDQIIEADPYDTAAIPLYDPEQEFPVQEKDRNEEPRTGRDAENVILVVDDSLDMRTYIRSALEPAYSVIEAGDGKQGIKKAMEFIPDLIISDVMMPEIDGFELCGILKKEVSTSHVPIILLTAKASEENILQGLDTGADDYITKPFNRKILTARIKNLIQLRAQLQFKRRKQMTLEPAEIQVSSVDETFLKELQEIIEKNLGDAEFNVEQLGKKLYIGRTTLYRKILALTGEKPAEFIRSYRLKRGAQLLKAKYGNITEVAMAVGFSNTAYFTRSFKEMFHQTPSHFQASVTSES